MDWAGQLGVGFELEVLSFKVVVGFGLPRSIMVGQRP